MPCFDPKHRHHRHGRPDSSNPRIRDDHEGEKPCSRIAERNSKHLLALEPSMVHTVNQKFLFYFLLVQIYIPSKVRLSSSHSWQVIVHHYQCSSLDFEMVQLPPYSIATWIDATCSPAPLQTSLFSSSLASGKHERHLLGFLLLHYKSPVIP